MVATHHDINASPSVPQAVDRGLEKKPLPTLVAGELELVVADLVKKALSNPATWPGGLPSTPAFAFGPSTPPLDVDELEKQLVDAAEIRRQSECTDFGGSLGTFDAREIKLENLTAEKQHSPFSRSEEPVTMRQTKVLPQDVPDHKPQSASAGADSSLVEDGQDEERVRASKPDYKIILKTYSTHSMHYASESLTGNQVR